MGAAGGGAGAAQEGRSDLRGVGQQRQSADQLRQPGEDPAGWGRLEEALALLKKQEAICLELGNKSSLGYGYWNWGLLARQQGNKQAEGQKLEQALALFTELKMARERDAVRAELDKTAA